MKLAGVPEERWEYKTNAELAWQMVEVLEGKISYDWVGGESIYGNSKHLREALHKKGKLFVLDSNLKQEIYFNDPAPFIPASKAGAYRSSGRKKSSFACDQQPTTVKELAESLEESAWQLVAYRIGTKGWLKRKAAIVEVYLWSAKRPKDDQVEHYRLLLSKHADGSELKYSLVNDVEQPLDIETLVYCSDTGLKEPFKKQNSSLALLNIRSETGKLFTTIRLCV